MLKKVVLLRKYVFESADRPPLHEEDPTRSWGIQHLGGWAGVSRETCGGLHPFVPCCAAQRTGRGPHYHQVRAIYLCTKLMKHINFSVVQVHFVERCASEFTTKSFVIVQVSLHSAGALGERASVPWDWSLYRHANDRRGQYYAQYCLFLSIMIYYR